MTNPPLPTISRRSRYDAVVLGSGPNGLAAAIVIARAGRSVLVVEGHREPGGGARTAPLTEPGFLHDVCSAVHPMAASSPFFRTLPLADYGLEWIASPLALAHPLDDGTSATLERSLDATAAALGRDGERYRRLMQPIVEAWPTLQTDALAPPHLPRHPLQLLRFARLALQPAQSFLSRAFQSPRTRALFAGLAGHAVLPLDYRPSAAFALTLAVLGHVNGWPIAKGGSGRITAALVAYLRSLGGELVTGWPISRLEELPAARAVLLDVGPRQLLRLAGDRLPRRYQHALERYRYGPGVYKMDWALAAPVPWTSIDCAEAATLHLGGTMEEIADAERDVWRGGHPDRPLVLASQPTRFDPSRAPEGRHILWAYCHVPNGSTVDMSDRIERQIERFAPGFRDLILAKATRTTMDLERDNPNLVGGDIVGGAQDLRQILARPVLKPIPYTTPLRGVYLCSASTPPGGGVHGLCGYYAAHVALRGVLAHAR